MMYLEKLIDENFKAFFKPVLNTNIVQKILSHATTTSDTQKEVYDILVQSTEKGLDEDGRNAFYTRAYKTNPKYLWELYNTYANTDTQDLINLLKELPNNLTMYNKEHAILALEGSINGKKTGIRDDLRIFLKDYISDSIINGMHDKVIKDLGKNNVYEVYIAIKPQGLSIRIDDVIANDTDVVEESNRSSEDEENYTKSIRYRDLSFQTPEQQAQFMRKRIGEDGDLEDGLMYV